MKTLVIAGLALLAFAPAAAAQPGPDVDRPVVAGDWITACDATRTCSAFSLLEETPAETSASLSVRITRDHPPGADILLKLELTGDDGPLPGGAEVRVLIDGQDTLEPRPLEAGGVLSLQGSDAVGLIVRMQGGLRLSIEDAGGGLLASASLAGLQHVLARMDVMQRRDGTSDALFLRGPAIADWSRVGLFTPGRSIRAAPRPFQRPTTPDPALLARLMAGVSCPRRSIARLDDETTLVLITSDCGGPGRQGVLALVNGSGDIAPAPFETFTVGNEPHAIRAEPDGEVILSDPYWEDADGVLVVERRDRPYGDCGDRQEYVWDVTQKRFLLASYASMPVCRGVRAFIVTYQAERTIAPAVTLLEALDCELEIPGLDWGICWNTELKAQAVRIEARQRDLRGTLGSATGDALGADWEALLDDLRRDYGQRWLDSAADDVGAALEERLDFLSRVQRRAALEGLWGKQDANIRVISEGGQTTFEVASPGCSFRMSERRPPMLARVGDLLHVTVRRADFEQEYPALEGCFRQGKAFSVIDGLYFPLTDYEP